MTMHSTILTCTVHGRGGAARPAEEEADSVSGHGGGLVHHVRTDGELRRIFEQKSHKASVRTLAFVIHASWSPPKRRLESVLDARRDSSTDASNAHQLLSSRLTLPLYIIDVAHVDTGGDGLHLTKALLPLLVLFRRGDTTSALGAASHVNRTPPQAAGWELVLEKPLKTAGDLLSAVLIPPVHDYVHLRRELSTRRECYEWTVVYFGASWCPPCMRVLPQLPALRDRLDAAGLRVWMVKADRDIAESLHRRFNVVKIPTFHVFRNPASPLSPSPAAAAGHSAEEEGGDESQSGTESVGGIQNSNPDVLYEFIANLCRPPPPPPSLKFTLDDTDAF